MGVPSLACPWEIVGWTPDDWALSSTDPTRDKFLSHEEFTWDDLRAGAAHWGYDLREEGGVTSATFQHEGRRFGLSCEGKEGFKALHSAMRSSMCALRGTDPESKKLILEGLDAQ